MKAPALSWQECPHCGEVAWWWTRRPSRGDSIRPDMVLLDSGKRLEPDSVMACQRCGQGFIPHPEGLRP